MKIVKNRKIVDEFTIDFFGVFLCMLTQYPRMNSPTNEKTKFAENFHDFFWKSV